MPQLECINLSLGYDGKTIVGGLSFAVNAGDYLCIVGENGSGKSTLVKTLLSLNRPLSGEIRFSEGLSNSSIGYLPQQTEHRRDFPASVREIVLSGCLSGRFIPFYTKEQKQRALDALKRVGISELKNRSYRELSGGQQQRVLLARTLCAADKMLLLDEPAAALDPAATAELYDIVKTLNRRDNITVIMVSHDIAAAIKYADHILHIGEKIFFGTTEQYLRSDVSAGFISGGVRRG